MVADRVEVVSRRAGTRHRGDHGRPTGSAPTRSSQSMSPKRRRAARACCCTSRRTRPPIPRAHTIERTIKAQSGHVPVPIFLKDKPDAEPKQIADGAALWTRAQGRDHRTEDYRRLLPQRGRPVRRAGADAALPRRGAARIYRARLRARDQAVRPVRSRSRRADEALCPAGVHHRRGADPAALSPLRARPGRFQRPAAQRLARDDPGEPGARRHPEGRLPTACCPNWTSSRRATASAI